MCLQTYHKNPYTANKDIVVYKILLKSFFGEIVSPYLGFVYKLRTLYSTSLSVRQSLYSNKLYLIDEGLHAYTSIDKAEKEITYFSRANIYRCIIPKGSLYYVNEKDNEIVSNQLIVKRKLWFNRF